MKPENNSKNQSKQSKNTKAQYKEMLNEQKKNDFKTKLLYDHKQYHNQMKMMQHLNEIKNDNTSDDKRTQRIVDNAKEYEKTVNKAVELRKQMSGMKPAERKAFIQSVGVKKLYDDKYVNPIQINILTSILRNEPTSIKEYNDKVRQIKSLKLDDKQWRDEDYMLSVRMHRFLNSHALMYSFIHYTCFNVFIHSL